jgi:thiol:disulfide interchange protein DsbC
MKFFAIPGLVASAIVPLFLLVQSVAAAQPAAPVPAVPAAAAQTASAADAATVKSAVEAWLKGRYKVDEVRRTPLAGMWEVRIGRDLIYVDDKAKYAFVEGSLVELQSGRNLTRERVDELMTINFKDLPVNLALKQVIGTGKRVVAVFEDANCGYCKKMRAELVTMKDITIYTFPVAILAPDSETKAKKALCADDKTRAWNDMMLGNKVPANQGSCENSLAKIKDLAQKLGVNATPTLFFSNGKRVPGYVPASQFEKMLEENSKS